MDFPEWITEMVDSPVLTENDKLAAAEMIHKHRIAFSTDDELGHATSIKHRIITDDIPITRVFRRIHLNHLAEVKEHIKTCFVIRESQSSY